MAAIPCRILDQLGVGDQIELLLAFHGVGMTPGLRALVAEVEAEDPVAARRMVARAFAVRDSPRVRPLCQ